MTDYPKSEFPDLRLHNLGVSDAKTEAAETNGHERHQINTAADP
jgi:hypothetical protein